MTNVLVNQDDSSQVTHHLMHFDQKLPAALHVKRCRLNMRVDLTPLLRPIGADGSMAFDKTAFECSGPCHCRRHSGYGGVDIPIVEGCVCST